MRMHFEQSLIKKLDQKLTRDMSEFQEKKICYACQKGFCRRKGRIKAEPVFNRPGRFVYAKCVGALMNGKTNNRLKVIIDEKNN